MDLTNKNGPKAEKEAKNPSLSEPVGEPIDLGKANKTTPILNNEMSDLASTDSSIGKPTPSDSQSQSTPESETQTTPSTLEPETSKTKSKLKPSKKLIGGIVAAVVVLLLLIVGIVCCTAPKPLELNKQVTINDVEFSYPSEWSLRTADSSNSDYTENGIYIDPPSGGLVYIYDFVDNSGKIVDDMDSFQRLLYFDGFGVTPKGDAEEFTIDGRHATKTEISWQYEGIEYEGFFLIIDMQYSKTMCVGMTEGNNPVDTATVEAIIDSATINIQPASYTITFMNEGKQISQIKAENEGGGAIVQAPNDLKREGYELSGWKIVQGTKNATIIKDETGYKIVGIRGDVTVEAEWGKTWKATFTDGAGTILKEETVLNGKEATAPAAPSRDGYTFKQWNKPFTNITADTTIDAEWTKIPTASEKNALSMAHDYLNYSAFSYKGLIEQLEYEKFSHSDAVYAADNCGADWKEQAAKMAKQYLDYSPFSRGGLIDQLVYEGFTREQAEYGTTKAGL